VLTETAAAPEGPAPDPTARPRFQWPAPSSLWPLALLALTGAAFALRVHNLAAESLDIDEADVVAYALADIRTLTERLFSAGDNGPAYMLLVRLWMALTGPSEFSLRFLSALPGTLTIPLIYALGRRLFDRRVGFAAALLAAASTYLLYFAQMNKMYALVVSLTLASTYLLATGIATPRPRTWVAYVVITTALMATHVFGALVVPWQALYAAISLRRSRAHRKPWLMALGCLTLPYLPVGIARLGALQRPETLSREFTGPRDFAGMFVTLAREYGTRYDGWPDGTFALLFTLLTLAGAGALAWRWPAARRQGLLLVVLAIVVPVGATFLFVMLGAPLFASRYLIVTLPFYYLLWAGAAAALLQRRYLWPVATVLLAGFMFVNGLRWWPTAFEGARFREDFRGALVSLSRQYQPGDLVLVLHDSVGDGVRYYAGVPMTITSLEAGPGHEPDRTRLTAYPSTGRIWLVATYVEAGGLEAIEGWLGTWNGLGGKRWTNGVMVAEFNATPPA